MRCISGRQQLHDAIGDELGVSGWHEVSQDRIDVFAQATGDNYWLHVDPERARDSPVGGTIAHGLLTLSLGPMFTYSIVTFEGFAVTLNYGYEKVRFVSALPSGSRVRMRSRLNRVEETPGGMRAYLLQTFEAHGAPKPVCVAESVLQFLD